MQVFLFAAIFFIMSSVVIIGLGNPGEKYAKTRHNAGALAVWRLRVKYGFPEWKIKKKLASKLLVSKGNICGTPVTLALPQSYMNNSGRDVIALARTKKQIENMIVVHDDIDLGLGFFKISFGHSSGGHKGVESIIRSLKSKNFTRVRVGVSPFLPGGRLKKPKGEENIKKFILGEFSIKEETKLDSVLGRVILAAESIILEGRQSAMNRFNRR